MKQVINAALLSAVTAFILLVIPIFYVGIEFIFLPIILAFFGIGASGLITIPVGLIRYLRKQPQHKLLLTVNGLAIGFYIACLGMIPITNWDQRQRIKVGKYLPSNWKLTRQSMILIQIA